MPDLNKRMTALLITTTLMTIGFFVGPMETFPIFAGTLGTIFSVYSASQGYTDGKETK